MNFQPLCIHYKLITTFPVQETAEVTLQSTCDILKGCKCSATKCLKINAEEKF